MGLVVILPRNLAPSRGILRIMGTGYQTRMPKMQSPNQYDDDDDDDDE